MADRIQVHPWVTVDGADPLLPWEENTAHSIEPPTEDEMNKAITKNMGSLMTFVGILIARNGHELTGLCR